MNQRAEDLLMGAPSAAEFKQLRELHVRVDHLHLTDLARVGKVEHVPGHPLIEKPDPARERARWCGADDIGNILCRDRPEQLVEHGKVHAFPLDREGEVSSQAFFGPMAWRQHQPAVGRYRVMALRNGGKTW